MEEERKYLKNITPIFIYIVILSGFFSCNKVSDTTKKSNADYTYFKYGNISVEAQLDKDLRYHGKFRTYYKNKKIRSKSTMNHGSKTGLDFFYGEDGSLKQKKCWKYDHQFGDQYFYHENGSIASYIYTEFLGCNSYKRDYSQNGKLLNTQCKIPVIFDIYQDTILTLGDTMKIDIFVPSPPNCRRSLLIQVIDSGNVDHSKITDKFETQICSQYYPFKYIFNKCGKYKVDAELILIDKISNKIEKNNYSINIVVKPHD